jgi:hypothetical protein
MIRILGPKPRRNIMGKEKFELEYLLHTSTKVLEDLISTPSGLSEWFADDVNIEDDVYTFIWDGSEEQATRISKKNAEKVRFKWLEDDEDDSDAYFELTYKVDPLTNAVILTITDFAEPHELAESKLLWEQQIGDLKRTLGA